MTEEYQQIRDLLTLTTSLVLAEKKAELADLSRIQSIVGDAIISLRESFAEFDQLLVEQAQGKPGCDVSIVRGPVEKGNPLHTQAGEVYRKSILALQFEDIVQQIIGFARFRSEAIERILSTVEEGVQSLERENPDHQLLDRLGAHFRQDSKHFLDMLGDGSPVVQQSMKIGDAELF